MMKTMLVANGETEKDFVEIDIENCCDLKHTINSSGFNNRDAFPLDYLCWSNVWLSKGRMREMDESI
jgi:hypothetical protein